MHVLIAGGGIGGMTTALALLRRGFTVDLYEQASELTETGAGIQISPNGNRVLDELGLFEELKELSCDPVRKELRLWDTGRRWPMFDLGPKAVGRYGYPYLTVYRPDLLGALEAAVRATSPGTIHLGSKAAGFEEDDHGVTLILGNGERARGDVLIGADGWRSVIRTQLWGDTTPEFSGMIAWRGLVPMDSLPEHMKENVGTTWIGPGGHAVSYPLHKGTIMNFVATIEGKQWSSERGSEPGTAEECLADFTGWHEEVQTLIRLSPTLSKWALMQRDPITRWSSGRVSLVGDACHATLPFLAQGAVHSMEDGLVLARALETYGDDPAGPFEALSRYESARIERTSRMVRGARANTERFHSQELKDEQTAEKYLAREWSNAPIFDRYDWLYSYDSATVEI
ncbi:FAD-dependent monooxygenase [Amycolatopsis taiwanensis]|uniref:FAD-dependent monooxygenase n=1 Tax=Amycolatopsis taiwanensis TaxID=342230 RepID=UPI0004815F75|nr:FAD-dependent monooxygenase [Amycolatopsis taiwanensis]